MTAIYARQSVERKASISIEMQEETCIRQLPPDAPYRVYIDRGFSGTNTDRPSFQKLLEDVKAGEIQEVYVYKLDRISRSLCDFAAMMQLFRSFGVTLHSCRESFDTQTEIGAMLLNLLMMFAELEQKTIAGRIRDNYYARAQQHLALGGTPPYGYDAAEMTIGGRRTTVLQENPAESALVAEFYIQYGVNGWNLEQIVHTANQEGRTTRSGARWSNSAVLRILRSPVYVKGDLSVYRYFQEQGAELLHTAQAYCNGNGSIVFYSGEGRHAAKQACLTNARIAAGLHTGLVEPALWLSVQERLDHRGGSRNTGTGQRSWLQGRVVCGSCGESCYVRGNGKGEQYTYFVCRGKRLGICPGLHALRVHPVEQAVETIIAARAAEVLPYGNVETVEKPDAAAMELTSVEEKMRRIVREMEESAAGDSFLRQELERLHAQREALSKQVQRRQKAFPQNPETLWKTWWEHASLEQRRQAAGILLREIRVYNDHAEVFFR